MTSVLERMHSGPAPGNRITVARLDGTTTLDLVELWSAAGRVAAGLVDMGVGRGDRVGIMAANGLEWVLLDLAAVRIGAVVAGLEPGKFDDPQIAAGLRARHRLALVFADRPVDLSGHHPMALVMELAGGDATAPPAVARGPREPFAVKFTSGSTGVPKSMTASTGSVEASIAGVQELFGHGPGDDLFVFLPLSLLQQRYWVYSALAFGHDVTISTYEAAFVTMGRTRPTVVMGVPAFFEAARRQIERRGSTTDAVRGLLGDRIRYLWTGSAPAAPDMIEFFTAAGVEIFEGYGLNETCIATKNAPGASRPGSVGRALPGRRIVIGDDSVVQVHSDQPVATGYDDAPAGESERIFVADGMVRTGDLGHLDEDGYLYLQGRADDVIVLGNGRKVVVRPIEESLRSSPAIGHAVLFCPTDSRIVAVVSPADPGSDPAAIHEHVARCNATSAPDEQITRVVVAAEPFTVENDLLTSQHKPRRRQISATYHHELTTREGSHV
ncbi:MAG: AMP-binding protein [Frankiaceae bacterium]|nr:AMP-binding protein [Frankiaceae bacterium]